MSDRETHTVDFAGLRDVDRISITTRLNEQLAEVSDARAIAALGDWLAARTDGWYVPATGVLVAATRLNLFAGRRPRGSLGLAGQRYLTAHRRGGFYQRDAEPGDADAVLRLLGFEPGAG